MVTALQPISGFLNLAPVAPVLPRGRGTEQFVPFVGLAITDASTLIHLGATTGVPLTYTASGTFNASLQVTPATGTPPAGATRVKLDLDLNVNLDILVRSSPATANAAIPALADGRADLLRVFNDAITTDLLLGSLGSGSTSATTDILGQTLGRLLLADLATASLTSTGGSLVSPTNTTLSDLLTAGTVTALPASANLTTTSPTLFSLTATPAATAGAVPTITPTAAAAVTGTATVSVTTTLATDTTEAAAAATAPATATLTAAPAAATATELAAATNTALQRFLTDAAARAHDTVANNPSYAFAAAALYSSAVILRAQTPDVTAVATTADSAVRQVTAPPVVTPLPTSVT